MNFFIFLNFIVTNGLNCVDEQEIYGDCWLKTLRGLSPWQVEHTAHLSGPPHVISEDKNAVGEDEWKRLTLFDIKKKQLE